MIAASDLRESTGKAADFCRVWNVRQNVLDWKVVLNNP